MAGPTDLAKAPQLREIPLRAPRDEGEGAAALRAIILRLHEIHRSELNVLLFTRWGKSKCSREDQISEDIKQDQWDHEQPKTLQGPILYPSLVTGSRDHEVHHGW